MQNGKKSKMAKNFFFFANVIISQVNDDEAEELDEQTIVMMLPITDTVVRCMTHCALTKSDIASVIKKLKYVINEYDSMVFLEYKIEVGQT